MRRRFDVFRIGWTVQTVWIVCASPVVVAGCDAVAVAMIPGGRASVWIIFASSVRLTAAACPPAMKLPDVFSSSFDNWRAPTSYLPLLQLLTQFDLLLNGLQQLAVDLQNVDPSAGQFNFGSVFASHGLITNLPRPADDLVFGQVSVADVAARRVPFFAGRLQFHFLQCQLSPTKSQ